MKYYLNSIHILYIQILYYIYYIFYIYGTKFWLNTYTHMKAIYVYLIIWHTFRLIVSQFLLSVRCNSLISWLDNFYRYLIRAMSHLHKVTHGCLGHGHTIMPCNQHTLTPQTANIFINTVIFCPMLVSCKWPRLDA